MNPNKIVRTTKRKHVTCHIPFIGTYRLWQQGRWLESWLSSQVGTLQPQLRGELTTFLLSSLRTKAHAWGCSRCLAIMRGGRTVMRTPKYYNSRACDVFSHHFRAKKPRNGLEVRRTVIIGAKGHPQLVFKIQVWSLWPRERHMICRSFS